VGSNPTSSAIKLRQGFA